MSSSFLSYTYYKGSQNQQVDHYTKKKKTYKVRSLNFGYLQFLCMFTVINSRSVSDITASKVRTKQSSFQDNMKMSLNYNSNVGKSYCQSVRKVSKEEFHLVLQLLHQHPFVFYCSSIFSLKSHLTPTIHQAERQKSE